MRTGSVVFVVVLIVLLLLVLMAIAAFNANRGPVGPRFKSRAFMTPHELEFLNRLEQSVPELRFHAQVAMGALLAPVATRRADARAYLSARGSLSQKVVDYVAQSRHSGTVVAVIELDDRTHDPGRDARRDAMLVEAGYSVVRWSSNATPDAGAIRERLLGADASRPLPALRRASG